MGANNVFSPTLSYNNTSASSNNNGLVINNFLGIPATNLYGTSDSNFGLANYVAQVSVTSGAAGTFSRFGNYYNKFEQLSSGVTITSAYINRSLVFTNNGTVTTFTGYNTPALGGSGTYTNQTHFLIGAQEVSGNWAIYNATAFNSFLGTGNVQIGSATASPGAEALQVTGSSRFMSGTNYITVGAGSVVIKDTAVSQFNSGNLNFLDSLSNNIWTITAAAAVGGVTTIGGKTKFTSDLGATLPTYTAGVSAGVLTGVVYNSTNDRFETGVGLMPILVATIDLFNQSTVGTILTYTVPAGGDGLYEMHIRFTTLSANVTNRVRMNFTYTDNNSTFWTVVSSIGAATASNLSTTQATTGAPVYLKAGTVFTFYTDLQTSGGTTAYDMSVRFYKL